MAVYYMNGKRDINSVYEKNEVLHITSEALYTVSEASNNLPGSYTCIIRQRTMANNT
jgi:hypothetical protein